MSENPSFPAFSTFMATAVGRKWVVARRTEHNVRKYPGYEFLTQRRYKELHDEWSKKFGPPTEDMLAEALMDITATAMAATSAYKTFAGNSKRPGVRDALYTTLMERIRRTLTRR